MITAPPMQPPMTAMTVIVVLETLLDALWGSAVSLAEASAAELGRVFVTVCIGLDDEAVC